MVSTPLGWRKDTFVYGKGNSVLSGQGNKHTAASGLMKNFISATSTTLTKYLGIKILSSLAASLCQNNFSEDSEGSCGWTYTANHFGIILDRAPGDSVWLLISMQLVIKVTWTVFDPLSCSWAFAEAAARAVPAEDITRVGAICRKSMWMPLKWGLVAHGVQSGISRMCWG